ncbi:PQQ-binding-like beta-propeller repeat protein [Streptomyces sp. NPDC023723]|uniref:outer membrane protein assembly factor BamB family protein n=1 Tax=Streptomyces sp. NPDC023723 TaxID=3154323 RepID=UPI00340B9044
MSPGTRTKVLACVAVLLVATLGLGCWVLWGDGGPAGTSAHKGLRQGGIEDVPDDATAEQLFTVDAPDLKEGVLATTYGAWATATSYVKTGYGSVTAYDSTGGRRLWELGLPGDVCAATQDVTPEGYTAVVVRDHLGKRGWNEGGCDRLVVFDIDDGSAVWRTALPKSKTRFREPELVIGEGVVAVSWYKGSVVYPVTGGKALWSEGAAQCSHEMHLTGGGGLVASGRGCAENHAGRVLWKVNPRTGAPEWRYRIPKKYWTWDVLSTDPVTVAVSEGDSGVDHEDTEMTHVLSLDGHGRLRATIGLSEDYDLYNWDSRERQHVVTEDTLYLPLHGVDSGRHFAAITAFDLTTGEVRRSFSSKGGRRMVPLRMSGDRLLGLQVGHGGSGTKGKTTARVLGIDPATGHRSLLFAAASSDDDVRDLMSLDGVDMCTAVFEHGRLYFGHEAVTGPRRILDTPADRYLAVAFGTGTR